MNKEKIKTILILILFALLIGKDYVDTRAKENVRTFRFDKYLPRGGGLHTLMDTHFKQEYDYLKLVIKADGGKRYDIRIRYTNKLLKTKNIMVKYFPLLAEKNGIKAKGKTSTIYFIPQTGKCPGKKSECVKVPVIKGVSSKDKVIDSEGVVYGVEIYNGCLNGSIPRIKGTLTYHNYDE